MKKDIVCTMIGAVAAGLFGSWGLAYTALLICQGADLLTGLMVAAVFHKSTKSENGGAESGAMFKGLCRKFVMWIIIAVAHQLDVVLGFNYITMAAVYAFVANEALSLMENAGLMGIVKNDVIINAIDVLKNKNQKSS